MSKPSSLRTGSVDEGRRLRGEQFLDSVFGPGMGARHTRFVEHLDDEGLRDVLYGYHCVEADTSRLSVVENYLIGMSVLCAVRSYAPAGMFAKTLRQLGVPREKILAATSRLAMWVGGIPAAEAAAHIQRALREWDERGLQSMAAWFPEAPLREVG